MTTPNAIANAIVAGVDAAPAAPENGAHTVWLDGRVYTVSFHNGRPDRVEVTYKVEAGWRSSGGRRTRWIWGTDYRDPQEPKPGGAAAKVVAFARDPAKAKAAGVKVESPSARIARYQRDEQYRRAQAQMEAREAVVRDAAPALLAALKAMVRVHSNATYGSLAERIEAKDAALAAIAQAEGEG